MNYIIAMLGFFVVMAPGVVLTLWMDYEGERQKRLRR